MIDVDGTAGNSTTLVKGPGSTTSTTTTSSTTTTTTAGSTTTSTTLPPPPAAACDPGTCDDANPCTLDSGAPGEGCRHDRGDLAAPRPTSERGCPAAPRV